MRSPVPHNSFSQTNLLLNHIISTFDAKLGMLWFAGQDTFLMATQNGGDNVVNTESLASFLSGFYYRFIQDGKPSPFVIDNVHTVTNLPDNLIKLSEIEGTTSIFIAPVIQKRKVKGTLILGAENAKTFDAIDYELLKLLSNLALNLNNSNGNSHSQEIAVKSEPQVTDSFDLLVGRSPKIQEIFRTIVKISRSDSNVFIYGENGTGKELIARTIHAHSKRKEQAFIPVDCVALPETLLESELFGYEKGAFTGAINTKCGLIEYADKGTFFLDEITEMNTELQAKLLRVLQERQFRRIGGKKLIDIDIRIISATNIEPRQAIAKGKLREDLFYRLNVIPIYMPPLRERTEDIPLLIEHFIKEFSKNEHKSIEISDEALHYLIHYRWPGNIRELKNLIERLIVLAKNQTISVEDLPVEIVKYSSNANLVEQRTDQRLPYNKAKEKNLMEFERLYFSKLLDVCKGNISKVAKEAQVSRKTIYNILKKHSLESSQVVGRPIWQQK